MIKNSICLLLPYYGKWPIYLDLFIYTVAKQKNLNVIFFTDLKYSKSLPSNINIVSMSLNQFNKLASDKLGLAINITNPYKLCDLKPAYGIIFEDYILNYNYWAFGDLDLIYGKMFNILPHNWMKYDVVSFREEWISGSFAIFKNSDYVKNLFKKSKFYKEYFTSKEHKAFDECCFLYSTLVGKKSDYILEYDTQQSFTWVIRKEELENRIKVFSKKLIKESIPKGDFVHYYDGKVEDKDKNSFLYYHYITEKRTFYFKFPNWEKVPSEFYINRYGFFTVKEFLTWRRVPIVSFRQAVGMFYFIKSIPLRFYNKYLK